MSRFFIEPIIPADETRWVLRGSDAHHLRDVLRARIGDPVLLCDGARTELRCRISALNAGDVSLEILGRSINQTEPLYAVTLFQGLPKGNKMDLIVRQAVELGVSAVVPVGFARSVLRPDSASAVRRLARWNMIAGEAAKQCGRGIVPQVLPIHDPAEAFAASNGGAACLLWEQEKTCSIHDFLSVAWTPARALSIYIGPEGGITEDEVQDALSSGIQTVSLGPRILRTETAGAAVLAMILYRSMGF